MEAITSVPPVTKYTTSAFRREMKRAHDRFKQSAESLDRESE